MTRRPSVLRLDRRFQQYRFEVLERFTAGALDGALDLALEVAAEYPEKGEVPFWIACSHGASSRPRAAVDALRDGLARGLYWPQDWLLEDDDLAGVRGEPGFAAVVAESARLRAAAEAAAPPPSGVVVAAWTGDAGPTGAPERRRTAAAPRAVAVTLHGWGQTAFEHAAEWTDVAVAGVTVVAPESAQQPTPGFFVWDDRAAARAAIVSQTRVTLERPGAAGVPLLLAGFSQGGGLALDLALDGEPLPASRVLALSTGAEDLETAPDGPRLRRTCGRLHARLVAGEHDTSLAGARQFAATLEGAGIPCPLRVVPGAGHQMPAPQSGLLLAEVEALLA